MTSPCTQTWVIILSQKISNVTKYSFSKNWFVVVNYFIFFCNKTVEIVFSNFCINSGTALDRFQFLSHMREAQGELCDHLMSVVLCALSTVYLVNTV